MGGAVCVCVCLCLCLCVCAIDHPNRHTGSVQRQNKEVIRKFPCLFVFLFSCLYKRVWHHDADLLTCHLFDFKWLNDLWHHHAITYTRPVLQKFQDIEENHILHMKEIIQSYSQSVDETHVQMGEVSVDTHTRTQTWSQTFLWVE